MTDIVRLDYNNYPPGEERFAERMLDMLGQGRRENVLADGWTRYKTANMPPGLQPHPWASDGSPFKYAFVTPIGFTILDTVGVTAGIALAAAWRWHDIRHALVGKLKGDLGSWPSILDLTDSDIERYLQHAVLMSVVAAADRRDGIG